MDNFVNIQSGMLLGRFVADYLHYEVTVEEFERDALRDVADDRIVGDIPEKQETEEVPRKDPLDKWRKKAKFKKQPWYCSNIILHHCSIIWRSSTFTC